MFRVPSTPMGIVGMAGGRTKKLCLASAKRDTSELPMYLHVLYVLLTFSFTCVIISYNYPSLNGFKTSSVIVHYTQHGPLSSNINCKNSNINCNNRKFHQIPRNHAGKQGTVARTSCAGALTRIRARLNWWIGEIRECARLVPFLHEFPLPEYCFVCINY